MNSATAFHCLNLVEYDGERPEHLKFNRSINILCNPREEDPDYYYGFVILGENIIEPPYTQYDKRIEIMRTYGPMYGGNHPFRQHGPENEWGHDFAIIYLAEPVRDEWSATGIVKLRLNIGLFRLTLGHLICHLKVGKGYLIVHPCPQSHYTQSFRFKLVVSYNSCMKPRLTQIHGDSNLFIDFFLR